MSLTYLEAITELQRCGIDAIKVAQSTQLTSLKTTQECATALTAARAPMPSIVGDMTALMTSFTFQLLEQQVAYAKKLTDTLAKPASQASLAPPDTQLALTAAPVHSAPLVTTTADSAPPAVVPSDTHAVSPAIEAGAILQPVSTEPVSTQPIRLDFAESPPVLETPRTAAEASLGTETPAAVQSETLSKTLPAPVKSAAESSSRATNAGAQPASKAKTPPASTDASGKPQKIPSVSNNRAALKRGPSTK